MHQRDERRNDDAASIQRHGRELVAERLTRARRHDRQRMAAGQHSSHNLPLHAAKGRKTEGRMQDGERIDRSEEHTSELQSLMRISYAVFCLKKKNII